MESNLRQRAVRKKVSQSPPVPVRPLRALFMLLNQPEVSPYGRQRVVEHAQASMQVIQLGLAAIGHLLAQSAVQVEEQTIPSERVESLGTLMAELGELAALCHQFCAEPIGGGAQRVLHEGNSDGR